MKHLPQLLPLVLLAGCGHEKRMAKPDVDWNYTVAIPNDRILDRGCTAVMSFPHVQKDGITIPAQSLLRCDGNQLAIKNDETGRIYDTLGRAWLP